MIEDPYTPRCIVEGCGAKATVIRQVQYLDRRQPSPKWQYCDAHANLPVPPEYDSPDAIFAVVGPDRPQR
jgi:hypothetical protein